MYRNITPPLAIAALFLASSSLLFAQSDAVAGATQEAAKMVPANAIFLSNIDSQKLTAGTAVKVKLQGQVHLGNGPVLPAGTILSGQVVEDASQTGKAKLALRFTQAEVKKGQPLPIKVTIFNVFQAPSETSVTDNFSIPNGWDKHALGIDQVDALPGIDLHSSIDSPNSGVLVSNKKSDLKLSPAYGISLAIAPRGTSGESANGY